MAYKAFVLWVIAWVVAYSTTIVGLLYIYDPLQLYHKPYFRENAFTDDTRVQNKGIIKHYDFTHYNHCHRYSTEKCSAKWRKKWCYKLLIANC